jgi:hypothetical protein
VPSPIELETDLQFFDEELPNFLRAYPKTVLNVIHAAAI